MTIRKQVNVTEEMAQARRRLFSPEISFNWRPHGVTRYESAWSMLHKFSHLNRLSHRDLCTLFGGREYWPSLFRPIIRFSFHLRAFDRSSLARLQYLLKVDRTTAELSLIQPYECARATVSRNLRFCEVCIEKGFHSPLFQIDAVARCPIHLEVLQSRCKCCKQPIPYELNASLLSHPYACPYCDWPLWNEIYLSEWFPGLGPEEAQLFKEYVGWSKTVERAVRAEFFRVVDIRAEWERDRAANRLPGYLCDIKPMRDFPRLALQWDLEERRVTLSATDQIPYVRIHRSSALWWRNDENKRIDRHHEFLHAVADECYAIYRSVRRYLMRRYRFRRHRVCRSAYRKYDADHFHCHWAMAFAHWDDEWDGGFRREAARECWLRRLLERADYLCDMASYIDGGEVITHPTRNALRWLAARWVGMTVLASFYQACRRTAGGREHLPEVDRPYFRWEPADGVGRPHRVSWWMRPVVPLLDQIRHLDLHDGDFAAFRKERRAAAKRARELHQKPGAIELSSSDPSNRSMKIPYG